MVPRQAGQGKLGSTTEIVFSACLKNTATPVGMLFMLLVVVVTAASDRLSATKHTININCFSHIFDL